jgi:CRISPR-associated protein Csd1
VILRALVDLAEREGLLTAPALEPLEVDYLVHLGSGGKYLKMSAPRGEQRIDKRGKPVGSPRPLRRQVPRRSDRTGTAPPAEFLVDTSEFVFGIDPKGTRSPEELTRRRVAFRERVEGALASALVSINGGLRAVAAFLRQDPPDEVVRLLRPVGAAQLKEVEGALFAFMYEPDGGTRCVHEDPDVKACWDAVWSQENIAGVGQCLVMGGGDRPLARLHAKPRGIPPKSKTKGGVPLTSVNADAFVSYGLKDVGCAPISKSASIAIETALNRLLDNAYPGPDGQPMPRRNVQLSPDTALVYWSKEDAQVDFVLGIDDGDPETVRGILHAPYKGRPAAIDDPTAFYALVLSGMQGRGIVRTFVESTVGNVATNVERYLDAASLRRPYGEGTGAYPLLDVRRTLVLRTPAAPFGDLGRLPPALATEHYLAILHGRPLPRILLEAAVRRNRAEGVPKSQGGGRDERRFAARTSLIKAYLIRNCNQEVGMSLQVDKPDPPYRLGRLLALLDKLQQDALGDVNATIVDRFYGSASSTPAAIFPTLIRRAQHHMAKLRRDEPQWARRWEKLLEEITCALEAFPRTLNLEQQGLFALGFYHQRQDFFTKKEEKTQ